MAGPKITIYTDGAARGNPGPGGYGIVLMSGQHRKELSQGYKLTTNNRMELLAVIVALEALKVPDSEVTIYTDSKYVADAVEKGWVFDWEKKQFKKKKNPDLWIRFLKAYRKHQVKFHWVKGHANIPENERLLVTNHNFMGYFAGRYNFTIVGTVIPGISTLAEPNPRELATLIQTMRETNITAIFVEITATETLSETLRSEIGDEVQIVGLYSESLSSDDGEASTYLDYMRFNAIAIFNSFNR